MPPRIPFLQRIWGKIDYCHHSDDCNKCCWPWTGARTSKGYGTITVRLQNNQRYIAQTHRIVWEIVNAQEIPEGLFGCHRCNNRICNNPNHIYTATHSQNIQDAVSDGLFVRSDEYKQRLSERHRGSKSPNAKLNEDLVAKIRRQYESGETAKSIALSYGVSASTIKSCIVGNSWMHVKEPIVTPRWPLKGINNPRAKLNMHEISCIRDLYNKGIKRSLIAKMFKVSWTQINRIIKNDLWNH